MKTFVQMDVQNLFFSSRAYGKKVDFYRVKEHLSKYESDIIGLHAYTIRSPNFNSHKFEGFLRNLGYTLHIKKSYIGTRPDGSTTYKGSDQDIAICVDCMQNLASFDKWILMSGDGDFIDLCKFLKEKGKTVEIWTVKGNSFNKGLIDYADTIKFFDNSFYIDMHSKEDIEPLPGSDETLILDTDPKDIIGEPEA